MKKIVLISLAVVLILIPSMTVGCGSDGNGDNKAIEDTIKGYISSYNDSDFNECITYFTGYDDGEDAKSDLEFLRSLSGELEFVEVSDVSISGQIAMATVVLTIGGEESIDDMQLEKVDGEWKIIWEPDGGNGTVKLEAEFTASPTSGMSPLEVQFTDQSTGEIDDWSWDFDNDGTADSTEQDPTYTYTTDGVYTVSLTVTSPDGEDTEVKTDYIVVSSTTADFTASPNHGGAPLEVQFTDQSTGNITAWEWDFGDGQTSTEQNPTHIYNTSGEYTVSLEVTGPGGSDTETKTDHVQVSEEPEVTWSLATYTMEGTLQTDMLYNFIDKVEEESGGRMKIEMFSGGSLYQLTEIFDAVSTGTIDLGFAGVTSYFAQAPKTAAIMSYANCVASGPEEVIMLLTGLAEESPLIMQESAYNDIAHLFFAPNTSLANLYTEQVDELADHEGMTLACSPGVVPVVQLLGATAYPMDLADFVMGIQAGLVDGWVMSPIEGYLELHLDDVAPYVVNLNFTTGMSVLMNQSSFDDLPEDLQAVVQEAASETRSEWIAAVEQSDQDVLQALADDPDVQYVHDLTGTERDVWFETAITPVFYGVMTTYLTHTELADTLALIADYMAS